MEPVVFGLHTAEAKKWITLKEANAVKAFFNVEPDELLLEQTQFYPDGITKIWIEEVSGPKPRFYIHLKINFSRLLGTSNYLIMPLTAANIRKIVRYCFETYVNGGVGYSTIVSNLNRMGVTRKTAHRDFTDWEVQQVKRMLKNPVYTGRIAYGKSRQQHIEGTDTDYRRIPVGADEYIMSDEVSHEPIVSEELFEQAQIKLREMSIVRRPWCAINRSHGKGQTATTFSSARPIPTIPPPARKNTSTSLS